MEETKIIDHSPATPDNQTETPAKTAFPLVGSILMSILLALAGNSLFQLQLGKDIHAKAVQLEQRLVESTGYSEKMNSQLKTIAELQQATNRLHEKLKSILSNTQGMHKEIRDLDTVVAEIAVKAGQIDSNTKEAREQLKQIAATLQLNVALIQQMSQMNSSVISALKQMEGIQQKVNKNLRDMNEKTKLLEQTSVLRQLGVAN